MAGRDVHETCVILDSNAHSLLIYHITALVLCRYSTCLAKELLVSDHKSISIITILHSDKSSSKWKCMPNLTKYDGTTFHYRYLIKKV